jgi:hypothetical protein
MMMYRSNLIKRLKGQSHSMNGDVLFVCAMSQAEMLAFPFGECHDYEQLCCELGYGQK